MAKKAKRGRPATGQAPKRNVRCTDEQWEKWGRAAKKMGLTRSAALRIAINKWSDDVLAGRISW